MADMQKREVGSFECTKLSMTRIGKKKAKEERSANDKMKHETHNSVAPS